MADLPVYGNGPRVHCKSLRGPWQEVQLHVHSLEEIDRPEFWQFLEQAVAGFHRFTDRVQQRPEDVMPWKVLGQKWHFARKGFPPGKESAMGSRSARRVVRDCSRQPRRADNFCGTISRSFTCSCAAQSEPWATIHTKRVDAVYLQLTGPKNHFALGQLTELGSDRNLDTTSPNSIASTFAFIRLPIWPTATCPALLRDHFAAVVSANGQSPTKTIFEKSPRLQKAVS